MPPTADNALVGHHRASVTLTTPSGHDHKTMHITTMMSGDRNSQTNGFSENVPDRSDHKFDFHYKEPCFYTHSIYLNSAKVYSALRHESKEETENPYYQRKKQLENGTGEKKVVLPDLDFEDDSEKRLTFELAFETLKYQRVFEDLLTECSFFATYPECMEDESLVMVVLWDYQNRKFQKRTPFKSEVLDPIVQQVEDAIADYKTKLNASLARHRIKASAPSLDYLLPDKVRSKEEIRSKLPVYVWVNNLKTSVEIVTNVFKEAGYSLVDHEEGAEGKTFYVDCHCPDMLVFPAESREYILEHTLLMNGHICMQDKSSCIAPQSIKYLIGDDDDVIHVNAGSGVTTAHIASLMNTSSGHIWAFGASKGAQKSMEKLGARNIKFLSEPFTEVEGDDNRFRNAKIILVTADCSKSGISNPIDFIVNEGEDMKILKDLSVGETDTSKLGELIGYHSALLRHAMKLHKVQAIVYMTRSVYEAENEHVVTRMVEQVNLLQSRKYPYRVVPPVLPFSGHDIEKSIGISGKFIKFQPSEKNSGCFVAVITREPEDAKEATKDILARAQAKGLLGGKKKEKKEPIPVELQNGDLGDDEKLLQKRVKRAPRKLRPTTSLPHAVYHKPSGTSIVKSQINTTSKMTSRPVKSTAAISHKVTFSKSKNLSDPPEPRKEKAMKVSEHVKVVKHPAPFR